MAKQRPKISAQDFEAFSQRFRKRYILKKKVNALLCLFIALCGTAAVIYSHFVLRHSLFDRLRYMTYWGTVFTTIVSYIFAAVCMKEAARETEVTTKWVYFLRLSSATTEFVIFAVVMFGLTPWVPDRPDISSFPGVIMHLIVPFTTVASFLLNDPPRGKPKAAEPLRGMIFIAIYAVIMTYCFATGTIPSKLAPYSFLNFEKTSLPFKLACLAGILGVGYGVSWLLMRLNMKLSWVWFRDLKRRKKLGGKEKD